MAHVSLPHDLAFRGDGGGTIIMLVMDGLGGLPHPDTGRTELESAATPHLDALAARSSLGMLAPVGQGITPGSGPGHLALFGFDPVESMIGRGVLSALGVGVELHQGDVAARLNLATVDGDGVVTDRRAGRPSDEEGRRVIEAVRTRLRVPTGVEVTLVHEKEHRAVLVLRGEGLGADITDTDPQRTGLPPIEATAIGADKASEGTAGIVQGILDQVREILVDEPQANSFLARGFAAFAPYPSFETRYGLRAVAVAKYPMYRGVATLVGMVVDGVPDSNESSVGMLEQHFGSYDFYFIHFKDTDSRAHDGDFEGKVAAIEEVDALLPRITSLGPDVLIVTGDHSTPALYGEHSWHHVPTLLASSWTRPSADVFGESSCRGGDLGVVPGKDLMALALAHAGRLDKYGA
jgi:2,3-bisphosphoglycerate-independent phosphoglycerate mutase